MKGPVLPSEPDGGFGSIYEKIFKIFSPCVGALKKFSNFTSSVSESLHIGSPKFRPDETADHADLPGCHPFVMGSGILSSL